MNKQLKRLLCLAVALTMVFTLAACGDTAEPAPSTEEPASSQEPAPVETSEESTQEDGGESKQVTDGAGNNGAITVETTFSGGTIVSVVVTDHNETPSISDLALEQVPADVVTYQSVAVDAVSGATNTSNGILEAVTKAIEAEGLSVADYSTAPGEAAQEDDVTLEADVIIIGGGGAGLAAAVTAHQDGSSVIVLEKMAQVGGNTIISGAAYNAVDPGRQSIADPPVEDSTDLHYTQTYEGGDEMGNPELVRILVENSYAGLEWLESLGMVFNDYIFTVAGGLWPRAHQPAMPLGTGYIDAYQRYVDANGDGVEILLDTKAESLIVNDEGAVTGVVATGKTGNTITLNAGNGVIMATGGFGRNEEMREEYNTVWPTLRGLQSTNHSGATGDGLIMAEAVNANLVGMEYIQLLPLGDPETGSLSGNIEQAVENRIFINKEGNRFVDEGERRDVMTQGLFDQTDNYMWVVVDAHTYPTGDTLNNFNESIDELVEAGRAFKGDTIEELAQNMGVDVDNMVAAVEAFNAAVDGEAEDPFGRSLFMYKLDQAPFYAGPRVPTVHHTMGGLEINSNAQVLNTDGEVIVGLYACGEVTGGIHGTNRLGGNALVDTVVFGRIAGASASAGL